MRVLFSNLGSYLHESAFDGNQGQCLFTQALVNWSSSYWDLHYRNGYNILLVSFNPSTRYYLLNVTHYKTTFLINLKIISRTSSLNISNLKPFTLFYGKRRKRGHTYFPMCQLSFANLPYGNTRNLVVKKPTSKDLLFIAGKPDSREGRSPI